MNEAGWTRIEALFHQAVQYPPHARAAFLARACDDPELRRHVAALLEDDEPASGYFAELFGRAAALQEEMQQSTRVAPDDRLFAGRTVGRYRLEREIGRGGTCAVYLAHRVDGAFRRAVAVKILMRHAHGADLIRRFEQEQQLLSELEHPNIARLYDGGVTEDGLYYFVMERVDGLPIDLYCDEHRLSIAQRLGLFLDVAAAVEYAHRQLVIHRDLKPSNILVTREGAVKLLDFGIAKLLTGEGTASPELTQTRSRWMTPDYAAPEQVRGERTSTATDVYQLGVVLYRLLTGHPPYAPTGVGAAYLIERAVCETEPRWPSRAVLQGAAAGPGPDEGALTPATLAELRATTPSQLSRTLAGDLDAIVLRPLQKERAQRYGSVEALARDVQRYLAGLPVEARHGKLRYRARKFVRRHWAAVGGVALALLLLGATSTLYVVQLGKERDRARVEAAKAGAVAEFLVGLFQAGDPRESVGESATVATLLERGIRRAGTLESQPEVQAEMLFTIAHAYFGHGEVEQARRLWERTVEIRERHLGKQHPSVALGLVHVAWAWLVQGELEPAAKHFRAALEIQRVAFGSEHSEVANSLSGLGLALNGMGETAEAEALLREALRIRRTVQGSEHVEIANNLQDLAIVLRTSGDLAAAESLQREALRMRLALLDPNHPDVATARIHLALLLQSRGDPAAAETLLLEALAGLRRSLGEHHPRTRAVIRSLETLYGGWGRPEQAAVYRAMLAQPTP
jgi:eukaryotic-like serine/threonine-protein kinase